MDDVRLRGNKKMIVKMIANGASRKLCARDASGPLSLRERVRVRGVEDQRLWILPNPLTPALSRRERE
jgi:hypothetical protein